MIDSSYQNTPNRGYSGVGYYRQVLPAKYLSDKFDIHIYRDDLKSLGETNEDMFGNLFRDNDIVITKAVDNPHACSALAYFANFYKKPLIVDLDDNYFTVREDQPGYQWYYPGSQKRAILSAYLSLADGFMFSTQPLIDWHRNYLKEVYKVDKPMFLCPNFNDLEEFPARTKKKNKDIVIGWQGSTTHMSDLAMVMPAIIKILSKNKGVKFQILGGLKQEQAEELFGKFDMADDVFDRIYISPGTPSWVSYPKLLSKQRWDIAIAPLIDDEFNRNKSHIKWMEYAVYKIPCIASKVYPYYMNINNTETILDGETGLLAESIDDWVKNLQTLIDNDKMRVKIGENAYEYIKNNWQANRQIEAWYNAINSFLK